MFDTGILRREQGEDQINGLAIECVEVERLFETQKNPDNMVKPVDARMGQRNPVAHTRGAEAFAFLKRIDGFRCVEPIDGMGDLTQILKETLLARRVAHNADRRRLQKICKFHCPTVSAPADQAL